MVRPLQALLFLIAAAGLLVVGGRHVSAQAPPSDAAGKSRPAVVETATFAGGCFWCVESDFDKVPGVLSTISGFMGGTTPNPTYKQVTSGGTGHLEVVKIEFDPAKVTYAQLVERFWRTIDPYDGGGQFCDRGESYTTAIFVHTPEQRRIAEASKTELEKSGPLKQPLATKVRDAGPFTAADDSHQDFHLTNPVRYAFYRHGCGRDHRLEAIWGRRAVN